MAILSTAGEGALALEGSTPRDYIPLLKEKEQGAPRARFSDWSFPGLQSAHAPLQAPVASPLGQEQEDCDEEEEGMEGEVSLKLHPAFDDDLERNLQGMVEDSVSAFVKQCVSTSASNQERNK